MLPRPGPPVCHPAGPRATSQPFHKALFVERTCCLLTLPPRPVPLQDGRAVPGAGPMFPVPARNQPGAGTSARAPHPSPRQGGPGLVSAPPRKPACAPFPDSQGSVWVVTAGPCTCLGTGSAGLPAALAGAGTLGCLASVRWGPGKLVALGLSPEAALLGVLWVSGARD